MVDRLRELLLGKKTMIIEDKHLDPCEDWHKTHYRLDEFKWDREKKTLILGVVFKHGSLPSSLYVIGERHEVLFHLDHDARLAQCAVYKAIPEHQDVDRAIRVLIPWVKVNA